MTRPGASGPKSEKPLAAGKAPPSAATPLDRPCQAENEMTERLPFRPLCLRTVASKGFCTPAKLQPTSAGARCKGEATGTPPPDASDARCEKPLGAGKSAKRLPDHASVRYWETAWSGVRAAEGARLEIAWAGLTRLEGSNPSHSVRRGARGAGRKRPSASIPGRFPGV